MTIQSDMRIKPLTIHRELVEAFAKGPDSAGILQGVRKLRKGRPHTPTFLFPSPKNGGHFIGCEGSLEPLMALALELNPDIQQYRGQPIELPGPNGRKITPDFAVDFGDGFAVIDIKPEGRLSSPRVKVRMQHIRTLLQQAHIPHFIITEKQLCRQPFLQIRQAFKKGLGIKLTLYQRNKLLHCIDEQIITVQKLREYAIECGFRPHIIETAAASGMLIFNLNTPWAEHSKIGVNHEHNRLSTSGWGTVHDICLPF